MTRIVNILRRLAYVVPLSVVLLVSATAYAASGAISQSYQTSTTNLTQGTLLSLTATGSNVVEPASSSNNASYLVGIAANKPLVELSSSGQNSIQVVVGGTAEALVSDANGAVGVGDKITASPISGIGMRATSSAEIVGVAQSNLDSVSTVTKSFSGKDGKSISVKVGLLPIAVGVNYYSAVSSQGAISEFVPPFLQSIANALTGKQISPIRVLLGSAALLLGFIIVMVILYASVRSGIISIGRNPLAEKALRRGLVDVIIAAIGVLVITVVAVYIILFS
jgi:hypothetical protein